jgi:putative autoinducer-2 (AI-2) aldolase
MDALNMAYRAINEGAAGVDMGRNIFQSDSPVGMMQAIDAIVHDNEKPEEAYKLYESIKNSK